LPGYGFIIRPHHAAASTIFRRAGTHRAAGHSSFVILPLLVNIILMGGAFWWLFTRLDSWIPSLMSHVPDWLQWLNYLLWPVRCFYPAGVRLLLLLSPTGLPRRSAACWPNSLKRAYRRDAAGRRRFWHHERYPAHHEA
jgi:hypothetical protein